jgi:hypothetical protein
MREAAWEAPIILVGAGRSGTTRLSFTLGTHRDVYMIGETSFLLPRLWATFNELPDYSLPRKRIAEIVRQTRPDWQAMSWLEFGEDALAHDLANSPMFTEATAAETLRVQRAFGAFFADVMIPPALRGPRWGFKEIWAGSDTFPCDWQLHRNAFPRARYVQSVRHPLQYLNSYFANLGTADPSEEAAVYALGQWVVMVRHARSLRDTGRYLEFRMEDFDDEWPRLLDGLELPPDPACLEAARYRHLRSTAQPVPVSSIMIERVEGLRALAEDLGYELPR